MEIKITQFCGGFRLNPTSIMSVLSNGEKALGTSETGQLSSLASLAVCSSCQVTFSSNFTDICPR